MGRLGQDSTLVTTDPTMAQPFADPSTGVAIDAALQDPFVPGSSAMDTVTDPAGIISTTYATGAVLETHPDGSYVYNSPDRTWISFDAATGLTTQGAPDGSTVTYDSSFNTVSSTPPATASPTDIAGAVIAPSGQIQASPAGGWTPQAVNAILGTVLGFGSAALKTFGAQLPAAARKAPSGYAWSYQDPSGMTRRTTDLSTISLDQVRSVPTLVPISRLPGASRAGVAGAGVTGFLTQKIGPLPLWAWGALGWGATRALGARRG